MEIILYSNHCPRCNVLTKKLLSKNIKFEEINDEEIMEQKGYINTPVLEINGEALDFKSANDWINNYEE